MQVFGSGTTSIKMLKLTGPLVFNPPRPGFKKAFKLNTVLVDLPVDDLGRYYIKQLEHEYGPWLNIAQPMFGLHVTIIKGFEPFDHKALAHLQGQRITLYADPTKLEHTGNGFWSIPVHEELPLKLREQLNVTPKGEYKPHLTVARASDIFSMQTHKVPYGELLPLVAKLHQVAGGQHPHVSMLQRDLAHFAVLLQHRLVSYYDLFKLVYSHVNNPNLVPWKQELLSLLRHP